MSTSALAAGAPPRVVTGRRRNRLILAVLAIGCGAMLLVNLAFGAVELSAGQVLSILGAQVGADLPWNYSSQQEAVLLEIRLPRAILGILAGGSLAVCGAALQGLFRNPLADPGLIGVSAGAAFAAVVTIVLGGALFAGFMAWARAFALPLAAFTGGLIATVLVYRIASNAGRTIVATMLLGGVAVSAIASAGIGIMVFLADDDQLRTLNFWLLGSLASAGWPTLLPALPLLAAPMVLVPLWARTLNALLLGEAEAAHIGVDVERFKKLLVLLVALGTGAAVALAGIIGFVGLVVPHMIRLSAGPDHRLLLPGAVLLGGTLLPGADLLARLVVIPAEMPIGIITALVGGPFFLWLLIREKGRLG